MAQQETTVGFIGLGNMGGPMCRNILANSGCPVTVYDLKAEAVERCTAAGAAAADSVAALAARADVILTSLPHPRDVEQVVLGDGGVAEHLKPGAVYVDLSTNSPLVARKVAAALEARGASMLDAPVSGGVVAAQRGTLTIMAGGPRPTFEAQLPLLESFGEHIVHCGDIGTGCVAKIVNNLIAFCTAAAAAEGLMLGVTAGMDFGVLNQVIRSSSGNSLMYRAVARSAGSGDWSPSFALDLAYKDLHLALELADELGVPLMLGPAVHNLMRMARGLGYGGNDATAMLRVYEDTLGKVLAESP